MTRVEGIHLYGEEKEIHEIANKFSISKSWYSSVPSPHYEIVYPSKLSDIVKYVDKINKK